jgi:raffinose/stachyose/melibiose transport system substrate-binding protein
MNAVNAPFQDPVSRRRVLQLFGVGAAATVLAGCAGPGTVAKPSASAGPTPPVTGAKTGNVSFYHYRGQDKETFDTLISRFEKKNPGITVSQTITTSTDYSANALQKVRAGGLGDALPALRGAQFASFADAGVFTNLSGLPVLNEFTPSLLAAGVSKGQQLALPYQLLLIEPIINEDLFDKASANAVPKDWDSFLNTCEKLKSKGITPISFPGGDTGNNPQIFSSMVLGDQPSEDACAQIEAGKYKVTDDWFLKVLKKYQQLGAYFQPNFMGTSYNSADQIFATGQAAILSTGSYDIATTRSLGGKFPINVIFPSTNSSPKSDWYKGVYNATFLMGVNAAAKDQPAALKWLEFLSEPTEATYYANQTAQWVTVKGIEYSNPDLKKLSPLFKEKLSLAARYQFLNTDISTAVYAACTDAAQGLNIAQSAEKAQKIIDQARDV